MLLAIYLPGWVTENTCFEFKNPQVLVVPYRLRSFSLQKNKDSTLTLLCWIRNDVLFWTFNLLVIARFFMNMKAMLAIMGTFNTGLDCFLNTLVSYSMKDGCNWHLCHGHLYACFSLRCLITLLTGSIKMGSHTIFPCVITTDDLSLDKSSHNIVHVPTLKFVL